MSKGEGDREKMDRKCKRTEKNNRTHGEYTGKVNRRQEEKTKHLKCD